MTTTPTSPPPAPKPDDVWELVEDLRHIRRNGDYTANIKPHQQHPVCVRAADMLERLAVVGESSDPHNIDYALDRALKHFSAQQLGDQDQVERVAWCEVANLVNWLRSVNQMSWEECFLNSHLFTKAAGRIEQLACLVSETEVTSLRDHTPDETMEAIQRLLERGKATLDSDGYLILTKDT